MIPAVGPEPLKFADFVNRSCPERWRGDVGVGVRMSSRVSSACPAAPSC